MVGIQRCDLRFLRSDATMLVSLRHHGRECETTRSIEMENASPVQVGWPVQVGPIESRRQSTKLASFLRWLDNYFRATPEERMADEYNAYWK